MHDEEKKIALYENFKTINSIDPTYYEQYDVKRGLRNADGTGVVAGLTNIANVHGYIVDEGDQQPCEGELTLRGFSINDLIENVVAEDRFGYGELVYLLLAGVLPAADDLKRFEDVIGAYRDLPRNFINDHILTAPSHDVMNCSSTPPTRRPTTPRRSTRSTRRCRSSPGSPASPFWRTTRSSSTTTAATWSGTVPAPSSRPPRRSSTCCAPTTASPARRRACSTSC